MASHLIEVEFKGNRREFYLWEAEEIPALNAHVIVEADRGEDLGRVHSTGDMATKRDAGTPHGLRGIPPSRKVRRVATRDDLRRHDNVREQDDDARRKAQERVKANSLVMKISDAEWQWDRKKLTFYFTAEKRVDFRTLVRELASAFRTRIELKQIGVRDEAKRLDGIGRCGRQYCSAAWLPELRPVSLGVAKDQRLSLNPTQISGACGRLMCSLRYEHEYYVHARKRFPKEGKILKTTVGEEKVVANDIFRERVVLRNAEGEARTIPLAQLLQETGAAPQSIAPAPGEHDDDILVAAEDYHEEEAHHGALISSDDSPIDTPLSTAAQQKPPQFQQRKQQLPQEQRQRQQQNRPNRDADRTDRPSDRPSSQSQQESQPEGEGASNEKRPPRRRGRRGGRRNRGKRGGGGTGGGPQGGPPGAPE